MGNQEFETPQEALAHYGKKGMKWGVVNEDKPTGSDRSGSKPKETSKSDFAKVAGEFYGKKTDAELQTEGQKKLKEQANQSFPTKGAEKEAKRGLKADKLEATANEYGAKADAAQRKLEATPLGVKTIFKRAALADEVNSHQITRDNLLRQAEQVRAGKLTDNQKFLIGLGATAAVAGLAVYGTRQYNLHQAGIGLGEKKRLLADNKAKTEEEWRSLFGADTKFTAASSHYSFNNGGFFQGLHSQKALDRPEFTIPEGTIFQRLSNHAEDSSEYGGPRGGAYATFLNNDKKLYGSSNEFGGKKYTVNFQANGPARVPSLTTVLAHLERWNKDQYPNQPQMHTPERVYSDYHSMAGGKWSDSQSAGLLNSLKKSGYSAIVDDMDAGYLGDLPIVFFGDAKPATSVERSSTDRTRDSVGVLNLSRTHA